MRGCGALIGAAVALVSLYFVWLWLNAGCCDVPTIASTGRCLVLLAGAIFAGAAILIISEPREAP